MTVRPWVTQACESQLSGVNGIAAHIDANSDKLNATNGFDGIL